MVVVDRYFLLGVLGVALAILFAAGEFLGWWDQLGEFGFWGSLVLALGGFFLNASRSQAEGIQGEVGRLRAVTERGFDRLERSLGGVERSLGGMERSLGGVERTLGGVEQGVGSVKADTSEMVALLRGIHQRLGERP